MPGGHERSRMASWIMETKPAFPCPAAVLAFNPSPIPGSGPRSSRHTGRESFRRPAPLDTESEGPDRWLR